MYLADGTETTSTTNATTYIYHVVLRKLVSQPTYANVRVIKASQSTITVDQSSTVQLSDAPLNGTFRVVCPGPEGNDVAAQPYTTEDIPLTYSGYWVAEMIARNCSGTRNNLEIWRANTFTYSENGLAYWIRFIGKNGI